MCVILLLSLLFLLFFFCLVRDITRTLFSSTVEIMIIIEVSASPNTLHFYWESIYEEFDGKLVIIVRKREQAIWKRKEKNTFTTVAEFIMFSTFVFALWSPLTMMTTTTTAEKKRWKQQWARERHTHWVEKRVCKTLWFILFAFSSFVSFTALTFTFDFRFFFLRHCCCCSLPTTIVKLSYAHVICIIFHRIIWAFFVIFLLCFRTLSTLSYFI